MKKTIWSEYLVKDFPTLTKNTKTSVLVVGGGICGILCAYFLVKEGLDVILLESDKICNKKTHPLVCFFVFFI